MSYRGAQSLSFLRDFNGGQFLFNQPVVLKRGASQTVLPPISSRTMQHPSFLPVYMPTGFPHILHGDSFQGFAISPTELFYTDPTLPCGRRIYNEVSGKIVLDGSRLNTPLPIMSACVAPPNHPDPFRAGPHPTNNLGSPSWRVPPAQGQPRFVVIQLTQQEDQVITNLLKLHHQEASQSKDRVGLVPVDFSSAGKSNPGHFNGASHDGANVVICGNAVGGRRWSEAEYEAANTLLSSFQQQDYLIGTSETELECQTLATSQNGSCIKENGDVSSEEDLTKCPPVLEPEKSFHLQVESGSEERMLTDLEGNAVQVLLSLADGITSIVMQ